MNLLDLPDECVLCILHYCNFEYFSISCKYSYRLTLQLKFHKLLQTLKSYYFNTPIQSLSSYKLACINCGSTHLPDICLNCTHTIGYKKARKSTHFLIPFSDIGYGLHSDTSSEHSYDSF